MRRAKDDEVRVAVIWAMGRIGEARLTDFVVEALNAGPLAVSCAAAEALEKMVIVRTTFETSAALRAAFEKVEDPLQRCPEVLLPVQEGGTKVPIVKYRNYQLGLVRALHATDDPLLIRWLVQNQEGVESRTHAFMKKSYEQYIEKDKRGAFNKLRKMDAYQRMKRRMDDKKAKPAKPDEAKPGADGGIATPDAGAPEPDAARDVHR